MNFGEYFRKLRTEQHMTQKEIASRLGVSRQAISHWENNKNLPDLEMLIQISETFGISLDQLLTNGEGKPSASEESEPVEEQHSGHRHHYSKKDIRRLKLNLLTFCIGAVLLFSGIGYVGVDNGMESRIKIVTIICKSYVLVPLGFIFIFGSVFAFILFELRHLTKHASKNLKTKDSDSGKESNV